MTAAHDRYTADSSSDPVDIVGRCSAHGCPNIWTTASTRLCQWHSAAPRLDWPQVTDDLLRLVTDNARAKQDEPAPHRHTIAEKRDILGRLRILFRDQAQRDPKAWAYALRAREQAGETLTTDVRLMWRDAIGEGSDYIAPDHDERTLRLKAEAARKVAEYAATRGLALADAPLPDDPMRARGFAEGRA